MKRLASILLFIILTALLIPMASADVIFVPEGNSFFESHYSEMDYEVRNYYMNGPEGYVAFWSEPEGYESVCVIPNGEILEITYTLDWRGELWGLNDDYYGWAKMSELVRMYDCISFAEEYGHLFHDYEGDADALLMLDGEVCVWPYPGAAAVEYTLPFSQEDRESLIWALSGTEAFTDEYGRTWAYISYLYGYRDLWICVDEPTNANLESWNAVPKPDLIASVADINAVKPTSERNNAPMLFLIGAMVLVLIAATVLLIRLLGKRG